MKEKQIMTQLYIWKQITLWTSTTAKGRDKHPFIGILVKTSSIGVLSLKAGSELYNCLGETAKSSFPLERKPKSEAIVGIKVFTTAAQSDQKQILG